MPFTGFLEPHGVFGDVSYVTRKTQIQPTRISAVYVTNIVWRRCGYWCSTMWLTRRPFMYVRG
jgi:hypothetical protein